VHGWAARRSAPSALESGGGGASPTASEGGVRHKRRKKRFGISKFTMHCISILPDLFGHPHHPGFWFRPTKACRELPLLCPPDFNPSGLSADHPNIRESLVLRPACPTMSTSSHYSSPRPSARCRLLGDLSRSRSGGRDPEQHQSLSLVPHACDLMSSCRPAVLSSTAFPLSSAASRALPFGGGSEEHDSLAAGRRAACLRPCTGGVDSFLHLPVARRDARRHRRFTAMAGSWGQTGVMDVVIRRSIRRARHLRWLTMAPSHAGRPRTLLPVASST
jgi:hypothetical protein